MDYCGTRHDLPNARTLFRLAVSEPFLNLLIDLIANLANFTHDAFGYLFVVQVSHGKRKFGQDLWLQLRRGNCFDIRSMNFIE